jgi:hypothetical protein
MNLFHLDPKIKLFLATTWPLLGMLFGLVNGESLSCRIIHTESGKAMAEIPIRLRVSQRVPFLLPRPSGLSVNLSDKFVTALLESDYTHLPTLSKFLIYLVCSFPFINNTRLRASSINGGCSFGFYSLSLRRFKRVLLISRATAVSMRWTDLGGNSW